MRERRREEASGRRARAHRRRVASLLSEALRDLTQSLLQLDLRQLLRRLLAIVEFFERRLLRRGLLLPAAEVLGQSALDEAVGLRHRPAEQLLRRRLERAE